jgi:hypothetical protein
MSLQHVFFHPFFVQRRAERGHSRQPVAKDGELWVESAKLQMHLKYKKHPKNKKTVSLTKIPSYMYLL